MRRLLQIGPVTRISLGIICLIFALVLVFDSFFSLLPRRQAQQAEARGFGSRVISDQVGVLLANGDQKGLQTMIDRLTSGNSEIDSIGIRRTDSTLVAASRDHVSRWASLTPTHVTVPLFADKTRWGEVELVFTDRSPRTIIEWLREPGMLFLIMLSTLGFVLVYGYLRRALHYLDPSYAVPQRVRAAFDTLTEAVLILNAKGQIMLANAVFRKMAEGRGEQIEGKAIAQLDWLIAGLVKPGGTIDYPWLAALRTNQTVQGCNLKVTLPDGSRHELIMNCSVINDGSGVARGCLVTLDDVTELSEANAELALSVETLRQLGDVGRTITANLDADAVFEALHRQVGRLLDVSAMAIYRANDDDTAFAPVFARQDGQSQQDVQGSLLDSLARSVPRVACERQELLVESEVGQVPALPGAARPMLTSLFAPLVADERLLGVMAIQSDRAHAYGDRECMIFRALCAYGAIALDNASTYRRLESTLRKLNQTQSELLERNQELARVNKLQEEQQSELTRFLAVASHDLRQPMHSLNLYLGALSNYELPEPARPVLGNVRQCAQIMDDMFLALLDLSRLDAQVVAPHIEHFPIASLLSRIAVEFAPQAKAKGLQLRVAPCSAWVQSDPALVEQILRNLTANAVRYTESGGIVIGCRRRGAQLRLAVFDTGIGIAADQQKTVFEEFCQIGNTGRDRTKGLGLGLAIVHRLARLLDTPITLESEPGKGSMFAIDLQRIDRLQAGWQPGTPQGAAQEAQPLTQDRLAGKLIVVVDDEVSILDAMRVLLEQWGCAVVTALSGPEAIVKLGESMRAPDVLICDYRLRLNENGLDVIKTLQSEFNLDIPVLIITGTITPARMKEMTSTGVPVLHKPVNAATLQEMLVRLVSEAQT